MVRYLNVDIPYYPWLKPEALRRFSVKYLRAFLAGIKFALIQFFPVPCREFREFQESNEKRQLCSGSMLALTLSLANIAVVISTMWADLETTFVRR
ncbi:hypothetical protein BWK47_02905 [Synechocystis sp. CACIAM 05]|nr:hypothetical protein BWK47_02905 [Synechocystis sp. CACIAM 05]